MLPGWEAGSDEHWGCWGNHTENSGRISRFSMETYSGWWHYNILFFKTLCKTMMIPPYFATTDIDSLLSHPWKRKPSNSTLQNHPSGLLESVTQTVAGILYEGCDGSNECFGPGWHWTVYRSLPHQYHFPWLHLYARQHHSIWTGAYFIYLRYLTFYE